MIKSVNEMGIDILMDYFFGLKEADIDWNLWNKMGKRTSYPIIN
jgi:hypothetical protein